jgi:hypothetical protein
MLRPSGHDHGRIGADSWLPGCILVTILTAVMHGQLKWQLGMCWRLCSCSCSVFMHGIVKSMFRLAPNGRHVNILHCAHTRWPQETQSTWIQQEQKDLDATIVTSMVKQACLPQGSWSVPLSLKQADSSFGVCAGLPLDTRPRPAEPTDVAVVARATAPPLLVLPWMTSGAVARVAPVHL